MHVFSNRQVWLALLLTTAPVCGPLALARSAPQVDASAKRAVRGASWIELQASTGQRIYALGEPIQVKLRATNIQSRDAYLKFASSQRFEIQVFKTGEREPALTWSANKMFALTTAHIKLKQGESETYTAEIGSEMGELQPGTYRLEAHLTNSSQITARPIEFTVAARASSADEPQLARKATLTATTDKSVYAVGEAVKIEFSLQNNAQQPATFDFNSGQTYDVFIRDAAGEVVWNWSANQRFAMLMRSVTLAAGEKQNFSVQWDGRGLPDQQITPGRYTVEAVYTAMPTVRAAPIAIEIR